MVSETLIVVDEDFRSHGRQYATLGGRLDAMVNEYIDKLEEIRAGAIIEGSVAESLTLYIECAKRLKGEIREVSRNLEHSCDDYIDSIDQADGFLF